MYTILHVFDAEVFWFAKMVLDGSWQLNPKQFHFFRSENERTLGLRPRLVLLTLWLFHIAKVIVFEHYMSDSLIGI